MLNACANQISTAATYRDLVNDLSPISPTLVDAHREATDDFNRWRGRCIECFARIEQATIRAMNAFIEYELLKAGEDQTMFGPRLKAVEKALKTPPLSKPGKHCRDALTALQSAIDRRNILVHATGSIWIDNHNNWLWTYHFMSNAKGNPTEVGKLGCDEAGEIERLLASKSRSFCDHLNNVVIGLKKAAVTK